MLLDVWLFGFFIILGGAGVVCQFVFAGSRFKRISKYLFLTSILFLTISMIISFG